MFSRKLVGTLGAGVAALGMAAAATPAQAATFPVNTEANNGAGSLRSAINAAEATNRPDTIVFEIPGDGVHTIQLASPLPVISKPLNIRGYTQPGSREATEDAPAEPKIVIDAANVLRGIDIGGDDVKLRGLVVKNALGDGIRVEGARNVIAGSHIGTNAAGDDDRPNGVGVTVVGQDNVIGGPDPADRNVIAGNLAAEVDVTDGSGHVVEGNRIGTNAAGKAGFNGGAGVHLGSPGNTVRGNQIGDEFDGILVESDDNTLQGNDIGTKASGKRALPNFFGIHVRSGERNRIGGTGEGEGNLVSGNHYAGIRLESDSDRSEIQGNLIGTTFTGRAPLPNGAAGGYAGVSVFGSSANTVGGTEIGAGNVISSNDGDGVRITGGAVGNRVLGNWIGTNKTARRDLGNGRSGVRIDGGEGNSVGDDDEAGPFNRIMHNGDDGVTVVGGAEHALLRNLMSRNGNLAIDLGADGSTANDPNDLDTGANDLQNGPEIDEASTTEVVWELETQPDTSYRLEFYACDGPAAGQGERYLGSTTTFTDANGDADDTTPLATPLDVGEHVAMTATEVALAPRDTSELSPCEEVE